MTGIEIGVTIAPLTVGFTHNKDFSMTGTIKSILSDKGFGFISPAEGGKDVFFHTSEVIGMQFANLKIGDVVSFEISDSPKGPKATGVSLA